MNLDINFKIILIKKTTLVRSGGRCLKFVVYSAYKNSKFFGIGKGKSRDLSNAISISYKKARLNAFEYNLNVFNINKTYSVKVGNTFLSLVPFNKRGFYVGGCVRCILKFLGVKNILCIIIGSKNKVNLISAIILIFNIIFN